MTRACLVLTYMRIGPMHTFPLHKADSSSPFRSHHLTQETQQQALPSERSIETELAPVEPAAPTSSAANEKLAVPQALEAKAQRKGSIFSAIGRYAGTMLSNAASVGGGGSGRKKASSWNSPVNHHLTFVLSGALFG